MTVLLSVYSNCFALCNIHIVAFKAGIDDRLKFKDLVVKTVSIFIGKIPVYCNTTFTTWLIWLSSSVLANLVVFFFFAMIF